MAEKKPTPPFEHDVAFSFLAKDATVAQDLESRLRPGLKTFVYLRRKEELLGKDGMDAFTEVFRHKSRLAVILYREGWGTTPWTGLEESAIKSRALETRFSSMIVVRLDKSELPTWIPSQLLYVSEDSETRQEMAAVIRARAREQGATVRKLSAAELAVEKAQHESKKAAREDRARSFKAPAEIEQEMSKLYDHIVRIVGEIKEKDPTFDITAGVYRDTCVISSARSSVSIVLMKYGNTLRDRVVRVNRWKGPHAMPSLGNPQPGGYNHNGATHYSPVISPDDDWAWKWEPNFDNENQIIFLGTTDEVYSSEDLAEQIIKDHVDRIFD